MTPRQKLLVLLAKKESEKETLVLALKSPDIDDRLYRKLSSQYRALLLEIDELKGALGLI